MARTMGVPLVVEKIKEATVPHGQSCEAYWRQCRYEFLLGLGGPVVTGHHLDDAVETWVWGMCHGTPRLPHLRRNNVYRPFLMVPKQQMHQRLLYLNIPWIQDPLNEQMNLTRNLIRAQVLPQLLRVNPGLSTVVKRKIHAQYQTYVSNAQVESTRVRTPPMSLST
jgi:tRNA(Ile)-lysidine synthase